MDFLQQQLVKKFLPQLKPAIEQGQTALKKYLDGIELQGDETHACVVSDFKSNGELKLIVAAFSMRTFRRKIADFSATDLTTLITKIV